MYVAFKHLLQTPYRLELLTVNKAAEEECRVSDIGSTSRLEMCRVQQDGIRSIEIGVDHDWGATTEVHKLLPPIRYIVGRPPGFQHQISGS